MRKKSHELGLRPVRALLAATVPWRPPRVLCSRERAAGTLEGCWLEVVLDALSAWWVRDVLEARKTLLEDELAHAVKFDKSGLTPCKRKDREKMMSAVHYLPQPPHETSGLLNASGCLLSLPFWFLSAPDEPLPHSSGAASLLPAAATATAPCTLNRQASS